MRTLFHELLEDVLLYFGSIRVKKINQTRRAQHEIDVNDMDHASLRMHMLMQKSYNRIGNRCVCGTQKETTVSEHVAGGVWVRQLRSRHSLVSLSPTCGTVRTVGLDFGHLRPSSWLTGWLTG